MKEFMAILFAILFAFILVCGAIEARIDKDAEIEIKAIENYLNNPSAYKVDSISVNGVFDHIEVKKL